MQAVDGSPQRVVHSAPCPARKLAPGWACGNFCGLAAADSAPRPQVLLSLLLAGAGGGRATDATGERLAALLGALAAAPADQAPVLLAGAAGARGM